MNQNEPGGAVPQFAGNLSANWKCEAKTMVKLKLIGGISDFVPGIEALKPDLPLCFGEDGIPVTVEKGDKMVACLSNKQGKIVYGEKVQFFRALSYFAQCGALCSVEETPCFRKNGVMFDMSRNAVMKPEAAALQRKCAWQEQAGKIVRAKDRAAAKALAASPPSAVYALCALKDAWRSLWYATRKTSGFEVIDLRLGALVQRMESAGRRMDLFADGKVDDIEELSAERLPLATYKDGRIGMVLRWKDITTPSSLMM